jgi:hypothetical protein
MEAAKRMGSWEQMAIWSRRWEIRTEETGWEPMKMLLVRDEGSRRSYWTRRREVMVDLPDPEARRERKTEYESKGSISREKYGF